MNRRWFGKVIGAIAAACGLPAVACDTVQLLPKKSWSGYARTDISQGEQGWIDIDKDQPNAWISAITAKALWPIKAGTRVIVADNYPDECHIFMSAVTDDDNPAVGIQAGQSSSAASEAASGHDTSRSQ